MIALRDVPRPAPDDSYSVDGFPLLKRHPEFVFGDGGAGKSLLALYLAGRLVETGLRVGLLDWELCVEDHRLRLEQLFGEQMPDVRYARCEAPLVFESDRVRRFVREERLDYLVFDSVAFACDGPPESAEVAGRYFRALRQLGAIGSLHVAHVSKAEGAEHRPFGSTFWHNGCRSSWFLKQAEGMPDARTINVALHHRKANLGRLRSAIGFEISFGDERTTFRRVDVADVPELAVGLSLKQRIAEALKPGALSISEIAERLDAKPDSVKHAVNRGKGRIFAFVSGPGGQRIGLLQRER